MKTIFFLAAGLFDPMYLGMYHRNGLDMHLSVAFKPLLIKRKMTFNDLTGYF